MTELLTASRLRCFRECARKHQLMYVEGWRPVKTAEALSFGTLIHKALEAYWLAVMKWQAFPQSCVTDDFLTAALAELQGETDPFARVRAEEMMRSYSAQWCGDYTAYEVLGVEQEFRAPLVNPDTWSASKTWTLAGKIDCIVRRRADNRVLVVESKTAGEDVAGDESSYWARLALDPQVSNYIIGAEALGYKVDECLYDVLMKPRQRPKLATPVEERKFTKDGRLYANQREFDETVEEYRIRVRAALDERPDLGCVRKPVPRAESQVFDFLTDAWMQAGMMRDCARLGRAPKNADACFAWGKCPMWVLCSTGAKPEEMPGEFHRLEHLHPELTQEQA